MASFLKGWCERREAAASLAQGRTAVLTQGSIGAGAGGRRPRETTETACPQGTCRQMLSISRAQGQQRRAFTVRGTHAGPRGPRLRTRGSNLSQALTSAGCQGRRDGSERASRGTEAAGRKMCPALSPQPRSVIPDGVSASVTSHLFFLERSSSHITHRTGLSDPATRVSCAMKGHSACQHRVLHNPQNSVCARVCMPVCECVYLCGCMYMCVSVSMCECMCMCICVDLCTCV